MIDALRLPPTAAFPVSSLLLATGLSLFAPAVLSVPAPIDAGIYVGEHEALGIGDGFGRWNDTIELVYDPDGAPAGYTDSKVIALIEEAFGYWCRVSGISYEVTDTDASALDDRNFGSPTQRDGLVRISWANIGGNAGLAGPTTGFFDSDLGYYPYEDGTIQLNNVAGVIDSDADLVDVLVHEIGHLLGLGHSDSPVSVMYANPYNYLRYPREDDIRAVQVMYGEPAAAIDVNSPLPAWVYSVPPQASAATTQFLFKPNAFDNRSAFFSVGSSTITSVTAATPNNQFVVFNAGGFGNGSSGTAIDILATVIVVDPSGYVYSRREWELDCPAGFSCGGGGVSVGQTEAIKTFPGDWKIYIVDESAGVSNARLLHSLTLPVTTSGSFNRPPTAILTAVAGATPASATFTVTATDPEGDEVEVVWHPPGLSGFPDDLRNTFVSGGSATRSVNFSLAGTHTFFVEARDDAERYGDGPGTSEAGEGFQTLLRVTVTLPGPTLSVVSTQDAGPSAPSQQMLAATAVTPSTQFLRARNTVNASEVAATTVGFKMGASSDQGATVKTSFSSGETVIIAGSVSPQTADVGQAAGIYIVVRTTVGPSDTWTYLNSSGVFVPWNTKVAELMPAYNVSSLKSAEAFEVFSGNLIPATHRIYIGYRLTNGTTLFYTGQAMVLNVN